MWGLAALCWLTVILQGPYVWVWSGFVQTVLPPVFQYTFSIFESCNVDLIKVLSFCFSSCFSAVWAFLWFVGFCFLTNQWQATNPEDNPLNEGADAARAAITFSFFSIFTWVSTTIYTASDSTLQQSIFFLLRFII